MGTNMHEHLIKPLRIAAINFEENAQAGFPGLGPGNAKEELWLNGREHLEGMNLNFSWGIHKGIGEWHVGAKLHSHPYPECLFFVGLDTANINYLGAEVEICLGDEREIYTFNDPTVVIIPADMPHGAIATKRLFSPRGFGFFAVGLGASSEISWLNAKGAGAPATSSECARLVKSLKPYVKIERGVSDFSTSTAQQLESQTQYKFGPGHADHLVRLNGKDLGMNASVSWGFLSRPGIWDRGVNAHVHPAGEIMIFMGVDPNNSEDLGAEVEIDLGKEHERYFIDKPSVVLCPEGLPHSPIITRWVDRPFAFILIDMAGEETRSYQ